MTNQREIREKKASSGMAPLLPVWASSTLSRLSTPSVMPGKYAAQRQATPDLRASRTRIFYSLLHLQFVGCISVPVGMLINHPFSPEAGRQGTRYNQGMADNANMHMAVCALKSHHTASRRKPDQPS